MIEYPIACKYLVVLDKFHFYYPNRCEIIGLAKNLEDAWKAISNDFYRRTYRQQARFNADGITRTYHFHYHKLPCRFADESDESYKSLTVIYRDGIPMAQYRIRMLED